jgi:SAM-dependent methyltransferase
MVVGSTPGGLSDRGPLSIETALTFLENQSRRGHMARKGKELTREDIANLRIRPNVLNFIELQMRTSTRSQRGRLRILDWGSGRGSLVIKLRDLGYEAFGVELDEAVMRRGFNQVVKRGERPEDIFFTPDKLKKVADGYFDLTLSHQVFEHVSDLDSAAKEMARLTAKGGRGFHRFPGSRKIMEPHVYIPFLHWLPKNSIRAKAIRFGLACGFGPKKSVGNGAGKEPVTCHHRTGPRPVYALNPTSQTSRLMSAKCQRQTRALSAKLLGCVSQQVVL